MNKLLLLVSFLICFIPSVSALTDDSIIFFHNEVGQGIYDYPFKGMSTWFDQYNAFHQTTYLITSSLFPSYGQPYDYWHSWVNQNNLATLASQYDVIIISHDYTASDILADTGSPSVSSNRKSLENYKLQYQALRNAFANNPNTAFIVLTIPPRHRLFNPSEGTASQNAHRANQFATWVRNDWLAESGSPSNVYVFELHEYLAEPSDNFLRRPFERNAAESNSLPHPDADNYIGPYLSKFVVDVIRAQGGVGASVIAHDDFEDGNYVDIFGSNPDSSSVSINTAHADQGSRVLHFDTCMYATNPYTNLPGKSSPDLLIDGSSFVNAVADSGELFLQYRVRYDPDADPLWSHLRPKDWFGSFALNPMTWSYVFYGFAEFMPHSSSLLGSPRTVNVLTNPQGLVLQSHVYSNPITPVSIHDGQWHTISHYISYDRSIVRSWVDGIPSQVYPEDNNLTGLPRSIKMLIHLTNSSGSDGTTDFSYYSFCTSSPVQVDAVSVWDGLPVVPLCPRGSVISDWCVCGEVLRNYGYCDGTRWDPSNMPAVVIPPPMQDFVCESGTLRIAARDAAKVLFNEEFVGVVDTSISEFTLSFQENNVLAVVSVIDDEQTSFVAEIEACGQVFVTDSSWRATMDKPFGWYTNAVSTSTWNSALTIPSTIPSGFFHSPSWITTPYTPAYSGYLGTWHVAWLRLDFQVEEPSGECSDGQTRSCGEGVCIGTQLCAGGTWSVCSSQGSNAGTCTTCDMQGIPIFIARHTDCASHNLPPIGQCNYVPDGISTTWDSYTGFTSQCLGMNQCSQEVPDWQTTQMNHFCNIPDCDAQCTSIAQCPNYCVGNVHYSSPTCNTACSCEYSSVHDCSSLNGWHDDFEQTRLVDNPDNPCTQIEEYLQEYRTYSCSLSGCQYEVTNTFWAPTGQTQNRQDGTPCDDGLWCTMNNQCQSGVCAGSPRCSDDIACTNDVCDEQLQQCLFDSSTCEVCGEGVISSSGCLCGGLAYASGWCCYQEYSDVGCSFDDFIVDNSDPAPFVSWDGSWSVSTHFSGFYGDNYHYTTGINDWFSWNSELPASAYRVYVWYVSDQGRPSESVYTIHHYYGSTDVVVDQRDGGSQWVFLGQFYFEGDSSVRLTNIVESSQGVSADAVRFQPVTCQQGDLNCDGLVNLGDFLIVQQYYTQDIHRDISGDGVMNLRDLLLLGKFWS